MKFLVYTRRNGTVAPDEAFLSTLQAHKEWHGSATKNGQIEAIYGFPEGGGVAIVNAKSAEELHEQLLQSPLSLYLETEVRPLIEFNEGLDRVMQAVSARKRR